jgi:hypothetical protein
VTLAQSPLTPATHPSEVGLTSSPHWTNNIVCEVGSGFSLDPLSVLCWPLRESTLSRSDHL